MVSRNFSEIVKIGLCYGAICFTIFHYVWLNIIGSQTTSKLNKLKKIHILSFCLFAFFATLNYSRYNPTKLLAHYDSYDLLHYYINAKYFNELGYFNLTAALAIADKENGLYAGNSVTHYLAQDKNDYKRRKIEHAYSRSKEVKGKFSNEKWLEFKEDAYFIQRNKKLFPEHWRQLLLDHGFNGTPAWLVIAKPLASNVPVKYAVYLTLIDPILILVMLGLIYYAFGSIVTIYSLLFICLCYSFRWPTIGWAFLRYDWLFGIIASIAFLKKEKYFLGGLALGFAALMRFFPILWGLCLGIKVLYIFINKKNSSFKERVSSIPKKYFNFLYGFLLIVFIFICGSFFTHGLGTYKQSIKNLTAHVKPHNLSSRRMGLSIATQYRGETNQKFISKEKKELVESLKPLNFGLGVLLLITLIWASIKKELKDWEMLALGPLVFFWFTTASYYYYACRLSLVILHAVNLKTFRHMLVLTLLFSLELFCYLSENLNPGNRYFLISCLSCLFLVYSICVINIIRLSWVEVD